ncbi:DUF3426 domain-containing protein [Marinomonas sp. CT5]|uniref:DUF3426 domain-containing protein n=1 Tax=Marinomonas sp. CT5 TaxID=2066133 RepID=UPI001BAEB9EB|nr:DUF3426 domain-containing protein [Marinomonas sp. CT5]QUX95268.1 DUF3426 domain-containing protein [Marinomonas sp. CT5]
MANSLITRCPKCSTAFRVSDEVLSMAKGKVRCGQCFHIFNASKVLDNNKSAIEKPAAQDGTKEAKEEAVKPTPSTPKKPSTIEDDDARVPSRLAPAEEIINPDWLHTLFHDEDLQPPKEKTNTNQKESNTTRKASTDTIKEPEYRAESRQNNTSTQRQEEPAPWEVELAEVEAALNAKPNSPEPKKPAPETKQTKPLTNKTPQETPSEEPDYMVALHSLAQTAAEQTRPSEIQNQHSFLEQLSAQESLAPLLGDNEATTRPKKSHPWLWFFASLLGIALLVAQIAIHFFDEGSRSPNFRSFYKTICSYSGCILPRFEDINAISIQHVRIQSHPSIPNTLLVNAIITNTSKFSQPMPKIALEFFDLNGLPVAARLFAPSDYLHKDFLDITYMPPNTPIHLVIPIQDPGARAVTHQIRAFPADTRSY